MQFTRNNILMGIICLGICVFFAQSAIHERCGVKHLRIKFKVREVIILAISAKSKFRYKRVFQMGFCTDGYVEIYKIKPQPKEMGAFFLAYRMKYAKNITQLHCGMTAGGAKTMISAFNGRRVNLTALLQEIEVKSRRSVNITPLLLKNG